MNRNEQKEKRRKEILAAALDLFIRRGYLGTRTQDISSAVGMSEGLLFHYFETREKLYEELIRLGTSRPQIMLSGIKGDALEFFRTAAAETFRHVGANPFVAKMFVLMAQAQSNDSVPESVKKMLAGIDNITPAAKRIRQGQAGGIIKKGNPVALAYAFWGAVQGIAEQIALFPDIPLPDSEWIVDILRSRD